MLATQKPTHSRRTNHHSYSTTSEHPYTCRHRGCFICPSRGNRTSFCSYRCSRLCPSYPLEQTGYLQPAHSHEQGDRACISTGPHFTLLRLSHLDGRATPVEASGSKDRSAAPPGEIPTTFRDRRKKQGRGAGVKRMDAELTKRTDAFCEYICTHMAFHTPQYCRTVCREEPVGTLVTKRLDLSPFSGMYHET